MLKNKSVLVTGATGFLGKHLVKSLCAQGAKVSILARRTSNLDAFKNQPVQVHYGEINDRLALLQATEDKDYVYHLAGFIAYKKSDREQMEKINVQGTANVFDACLTNNVKKVLHLSSVVTIGANDKPEPINENFEYNLSKFNLGYFETKRKAEELAMKVFKENNLPVYIINPSTIYGAGDGTKGSRKTQIKVAQGKFKLFPPGGVNIVYVQDVIQCIHLCMEKGQPGRRYIVAGENMTIKELFACIADCAGVPRPSIPIPKWFMTSLGRFGDMMRAWGYETSMSSETAITASLYHWFDNKRAIDELGFRPTPAKKAIEESISWMKENGILEKS